MSSARWNTWNEIVNLHDVVTTLLTESVVQPRATESGGPIGLPLDVRETADAFTVVASVPGVQPVDVEISVLGDTLRIGGARRNTHDGKENGQGDGRWLLRERRHGAFERAITLPSAIKADAAAAEFNDGVLTITLPKSDAARPRTIPVRGMDARR